MTAPSRTRILAASAVMLGAMTFIIVDNNHETAQAALEVADAAVLSVRGDSLLQAAAVAARAAADCQLVSEFAPAKGTAPPAAEGSETLFYMESLIPLIAFAFCIPLRRLWVSLQDEPHGDVGKEAVARVVSQVVQSQESLTTLSSTSAVAVAEEDSSLAGIFRESRRAFQEALDELDAEELATIPVTFSKAVDKKAEPQLLDWVALSQAAKHNDEKQFEELVSECSPNEQDSWGVSLLHAAALGGSAAITKSLLQRGANHSVCDLWDDTPLHYAARGGCAEVCQLLIDAGAKAARNAQDWTPLLVAADAGHQQACKLLFDAGSEVGATDCELPPLLQALIVEKLICGLPRTPDLTMTDDRDEVLSEVSYDDGFF